MIEVVEGYPKGVSGYSSYVSWCDYNLSRVSPIVSTCYKSDFITKRIPVFSKIILHLSEVSDFETT